MNWYHIEQYSIDNALERLKSSRDKQGEIRVERYARFYVDGFDGLKFYRDNKLYKKQDTIMYSASGISSVMTTYIKDEYEYTIVRSYAGTVLRSKGHLKRKTGAGGLEFYRCIHYDVLGNIEGDISRKNGKLHGVCRSYGSDHIKEEFYENGILKDTKKSKAYK